MVRVERELAAHGMQLRVLDRVAAALDPALPRLNPRLLPRRALGGEHLGQGLAVLIQPGLQDHGLPHRPRDPGKLERHGSAVQRLSPLHSLAHPPAQVLGQLHADLGQQPQHEQPPLRPHLARIGLAGIGFGFGGVG